MLFSIAKIQIFPYYSSTIWAFYCFHAQQR
uniref:Uncharacterized protein n=1 Tax=Arundo donax TaxID=35708 RepID=A0A0A9BSL4_ARUDO